MVTTAPVRVELYPTDDGWGESRLREVQLLTQGHRAINWQKVRFQFRSF